MNPRSGQYMTNQHDEMEARACLILGVLLEQAGEPKCAAGLFHKALSHQHDLTEARVRLGFVCWQMDDTAGMYDAFSEAVRLDPQAARVATLDKPGEAQLISLVLYPRQYGRLVVEDWERAVPINIRQSSEMMTCARGYLSEGRDAEARDVLERMLKDDADDVYPVPLLTLTYLLLRASGRLKTTAVGKESMLWKVEPSLARLLFKS
jgi:hypothetical protein